jgi:hypothetical protein
MRTTGRIAARGAAVAAALTLIAACAQQGRPAPVPADQPGSFGALDAAYDRAKWRWVRNPDGRLLLSHATVQKCFIDPRPHEDFNEPGFAVKRERKTIGKTAYDVLNVLQGSDFWEAVYRREGSREPLLGVYADGACRVEAERILEAYESGRK